MARNSRDSINQQFRLEGDAEVIAKLRAIGAAGERSFDQLARGSGTAAADVAALGTAASTANAALIASARAASGTLGPLATLGQRIGVGGISGAFAGAATAVGQFRGALLALGAGGVVASIGKLVEGTAKDITDLKNLSLTSGFKKEDIVGLQQAFQEARVETDLAGDVINKFSEKLGAARAKSAQLNDALAGGVKVFRGMGEAADKAGDQVSSLFQHGVMQFKGGKQNKLDLGQPFAGLIDPKDFPATPEGDIQALETFTQRLIALKKVDESLANAVGASEWGKRFKSSFAGLEKAFGEGRFAEFVKEGFTKGLVPSSDDEKKVEEYNKAINDLGDVADKAKRELGLLIIPPLTKEISLAVQAVKDLGSTASAAGDVVKSTFETIGRGDFEGLGRGLEAAFEPIKDLGESAFNELKDRAEAALDAVPGIADSAATSIAGALRNSEFATAWTDTVNLVRPAFDELTQSISTSLSDTFTSDTWQGFVSSAQSAVDQVKAFFTGLPEALSAGFSGGGREGEEAGGDRAAGAPTGFFSTIVEQLTGLPALALAAFEQLGVAAAAAEASVREIWQGLLDSFSETITSFGDSLAGAWDGFTSAASAAIETIKGWLDDLTAFVQRVMDSLGSIGDEVVEGVGGVQFARGGRVHGPGTGTSDSVPIWASAGEYVIRERAVRAYGPALFAMLNQMTLPIGRLREALQNLQVPRFATGGLVERFTTALMPQVNFAFGGMVQNMSMPLLPPSPLKLAMSSAAESLGATAFSGVPVHLHIGEETFVTMAQPDIVASLTKAARTRSLLSAGRKPGWVSGRRYGG